MPVFKIAKPDLREKNVMAGPRVHRNRTRFISFSISIIFSVAFNHAFSQRESKAMDSLENIVRITSNDSLKVAVMRTLSFNYHNIDAKKAITFGRNAVALAKQRELELELGRSYQSLGVAYAIGGKADSAIWAFEQATPIFQKLDEKSLASI